MKLKKFSLFLSAIILLILFYTPKAFCDYYFGDRPLYKADKSGPKYTANHYYSGNSGNTETYGIYGRPFLITNLDETGKTITKVRVLTYLKRTAGPDWRQLQYRIYKYNLDTGETVSLIHDNTWPPTGNTPPYLDVSNNLSAYETTIICNKSLSALASNESIVLYPVCHHYGAGEKGNEVYWNSHFDSTQYPAQIEVFTSNSDSTIYYLHDVRATADISTVIYTGPTFTALDSTGASVCSGSVATTNSPYWPDDNYVIVDAKVSDVDGDGKQEIVTMARHSPYYPGQVAVFDESCSLQGRYWNPGHLYALELYNITGGFAKEIIVGATNNDKVSGLNVPAIFALAGNDVAGEAPPYYGTFPEGSELWYAFVNKSVNAGIKNLSISGSKITGNTNSSGNGTNYCVDFSGNVISCCASFEDVPPGYWAEEHICKIYEAGITKGCSQNPLMYCPRREVSRAAMAVFLERGIHGSGFTPPPATGIFDDVPVSFWAADWIEQLYNDGITTGCSDDPLRYCPERSVTRAAMAVFLLRSKHGSNYTPPSATGIFADVPVTHWAADWIEQLYNEGITTGCKTNPLSYCPDRAVRRDAMAVFLVRTFGL